jgi:Ca2+-binding EF-hand superfamily protein
MTLLKAAAGAAVLAGLAFSAHAADSDHPPHKGEDRRPTTFLSPAGEPFHAAPGDPYPVVVWFTQADANHDGRITREEFRADFERFFRRLDANHDGVIDGVEVEDYEHRIAPEVLSMIERPNEAAMSAPQGDGDDGQGEADGGGRGGGGPGGRSRGGDPGDRVQGGGSNGGPAAMKLMMQGAAAYSLLSIAEPVAGADADLDGKISLAEFRAAADRRFTLLDSKSLGYLTLDALPRTPAQIAAEGKTPKRSQDAEPKP